MRISSKMGLTKDRAEAVLSTPSPALSEAQLVPGVQHLMNHTPSDPLVKIHSDCVEVPLSQGKVALVDIADADRVLRYKWCALCPNPNRGKPKWYAVRKDYSFRPAKTIYLHRFLMEVDEGLEVDHENGDGLDCRRANLREATRSQNAQNVATTFGCSRYKGVQERHGGWYAALTAQGVLYTGRRFETEEEAARAYDVLSRAMHGEFGVRNFPDEGDAFSLEYVLNRRAGYGRRKGEQHPRSVLTEQKVREIRRRVAAGEKKLSLAAEYGVAPSTVTAVIQRKIWTHLEDEVAA